tara:strand:+ start:1357 stop:1599 length:243 start_codon:yes stop_codon:yes gene_type:complete
VSQTDVISLRIDNLESVTNRHEKTIEQLVQSQIDMKTGLTKVATELEITNGLIASYMSNMQKVILALITIVAGAMGLTQM